MKPIQGFLSRQCCHCTLFSRVKSGRWPRSLVTITVHMGVRAAWAIAAGKGQKVAVKTSTIPLLLQKKSNNNNNNNSSSSRLSHRPLIIYEITASTWSLSTGKCRTGLLQRVNLSLQRGCLERGMPTVCEKLKQQIRVLQAKLKLSIGESDTLTSIFYKQIIKHFSILYLILNLYNF